MVCRSLPLRIGDGLPNGLPGAQGPQLLAVMARSLEVDDGHPEAGASELDYAAKRVDTSYPRALAAGEAGTVWVEFRNMGKKTWQKGDVWLAALGGPDGGVSALGVEETWPAFDLAAGLNG